MAGRSILVGFFLFACLISQSVAENTEQQKRIQKQVAGFQTQQNLTRTRKAAVDRGQLLCLALLPGKALDHLFRSG